MPQYFDAEGLGLIEAPDDATPEEIADALNRHEAKAKLDTEMAAVRAEKAPSTLGELPGELAMPFRVAAGGLTRAGGATSRGLAAVSEKMNLWPAGVVGMPAPPAIQKLQEQRAGRTAAQARQALAQNPLYELGQAPIEAAEQLSTPEERETPTGQVAGMVGGAAGMALGPLAVPQFALQAIGESLTDDYDKIRQANPDMTDEQAAAAAFDKAWAKGAITAGVFWTVPKVMRPALEKYVIGKLGASGFAQWAAGRVAAGAEGAAVGAGLEAATGAVDQKAPDRETLKQAGAMAAMNLLLPWRRQAQQPPGGAGEGGTINVQSPGPESAPGPAVAPKPAPGAPAEVTPSAIQELLDTIQKGQVAKPEARPKLPSAEPAAPRPPTKETELPQPLTTPEQAAGLGNKAPPEPPAAEAPADVARDTGISQDLVDKAIAVEAGDHPAIARSNPEVLPQIVADELRADPQAYAGELSAADQARIEAELRAKAEQKGLAGGEKGANITKSDTGENIGRSGGGRVEGERPGAAGAAAGERPTAELPGGAGGGVPGGIRAAGARPAAAGGAGGGGEPAAAAERAAASERAAGAEPVAPGPGGVGAGIIRTGGGEEPGAVEPGRLAAGRGNFLVKERPDGVPDILDAIQAAGGIQPLDERIYGNWRDKVRGVARLLIRKGGRPADLLVDDLNGKKLGTGGRARAGTGGEQRFRIETVDDLLDAIDEAVAQREQLKSSGGGPEAQLERFWAAAENPANKSGLERVSAQELSVGDKFRLKYPGASHEELTVTHIDPDTGEVTVKDGGSFGIQNLPDGAEIWVQRKGQEIALKSDDFEAWLDRAIEATKPESGLHEFVTGAPVWATKQALHGALKVIRAAYQVGKTLKEAIEEGIAWLRNERIKGFDEGEARDWLTREVRAANAVVERAPTGGRAGEYLPQAGEAAVDMPKWLTNQALEGVNRVIDAAVARGRSAAEAVTQGVEWMRQHHPAEGFNDEELRAFLESRQEPRKGAQGAEEIAKSQAPSAQAEPSAAEKSATAEGGPMEEPPNEPAEPQPGRRGELERRREEVTRRLGELNNRSELTDQERGERYLLARESLAIQRELFKDPGYVEDLLLRADEVGARLEAARAARNREQARDLAEELNGLQADMLKVEPKLLSRIYGELVGSGRIGKASTLALPEGRTLGDLTKWLREHRLDSPRLSIAERFNLARRLADEWHRAGDKLGRAADRVRGAWEAFKEQYRAPVVDTDFRRLMKNWFYSKQWTGLETHNWVREIERQIPRTVRRMGIAAYLDAGGNTDLLRAQAAEVPARWRPAWEAALNLTSSEIALANRIRADFADKLDAGKSLGLVDKGREHYGVPQIWEVAPKNEGEFTPGAKKPQTARNPKAKLDPRAPFFSLQRTNPTIFDGIMAGGVPRTLDIAKLVGVYNADFHNSLADRMVVRELKDAKAPDGTPLVMISGSARIEPGTAEPGKPVPRTYFVDSNWRPKEAVTKDGRPYRSIDHWALRDWAFSSMDSNGNPIIVRGDFLVHPDAYRFLKNELGKSWLRDPEGGGKYFNWLLNSAAFLKASKFASVTFHMVTLGEHSMFHAFAGKPSRERLELLWPSTRGVELDPKKDPELAKLMWSGTELGFGSQRELFEEGLGSHGGIYARIPGLGDAMAAATDFMFKRYLPALKVKTAKAILHANQQRYGKRLNEGQIYELTAHQVNAAFGAQPWRLLGTNKTMLDVSRLMFTAPDFLLSRAKVVAQAFKPYNREQTLFLLAQGALVYGAARVLNMLLDGDPHTEPENAFRVIYNGRSYGARFIVSDVAEMMVKPNEFFAGRLGPLVRSSIESLYGRDMRTGARVQVPIETENKALRAAQIFLKDSAEWLIPVGFEGFAPGATGREQTGPGQVAMALGGVSSRKYTARSQMYVAAQEFNRASSDPAARLWQKQRDDDAKTEGAYRKLDNLLEGGKFEEAQREYDSLIQEGRSPRNIARRYRRTNVPFTGTLAREEAFKQSLNAEQRRTYDRAREERRVLAGAFMEHIKQREAAEAPDQ